MTAKIKEHQMNIVADILSDGDMSEFEIPFCPPLPTRILEEGEIEENEECNMVKCSCRRFHYNEFMHLVCLDCGVRRQRGHHRFKGIKKRSNISYEESRRNYYNITRTRW